MTEGRLAANIRRYRRRLKQTADPGFASDGIYPMEPGEPMLIRSDGYGNVMVLRGIGESDDEEADR